MGYTWICHNKTESEKADYGMKTYWFISKEKFPSVAVIKEGHADSLLRLKKAMTWFCWKSSSSKPCFLLQTPLAIFT